MKIKEMSDLEKRVTIAFSEILGDVPKIDSLESMIKEIKDAKDKCKNLRNEYNEKVKEFVKQRSEIQEKTEETRKMITQLKEKRGELNKSVKILKDERKIATDEMKIKKKKGYTDNESNEKNEKELAELSQSQEEFHEFVMDAVKEAQEVHDEYLQKRNEFKQLQQQHSSTHKMVQEHRIIAQQHHENMHIFIAFFEESIGFKKEHHMDRVPSDFIDIDEKHHEKIIKICNVFWQEKINQITDISIKENTVYITAKNPGYIIGKGGKKIISLNNLIATVFDYDKKIRIKVIETNEIEEE